MPRIRPRLAAGLCALLVGATLTAVSTTPAAAMACSNTSNTTMRYHGVGWTERYASFYNYGRVWRDDPVFLRSKHNVGSTSVNIIGCKDPATHVWHVLAVYYDQTFNDLTISQTGTSLRVAPAHGSWGDAIRVKTITTSRVNGVGVICSNYNGTSGLLGAAAVLVSLPVPGLRYSVAVGKYIVGRYLAGESASSTTSKCGAMYLAFSIPWHFSSTGVATLGAISTGTYAFSRREINPAIVPCSYQACQLFQEDEIQVVRG